MSQCMEESMNDLLTSCKHNRLFHSYLYPKSRFSGCDVHRLVCGSDQCKQSRCKEDFGSGGHLHTQSINHLITPASHPTMSFSSKDSCSFGFSSPPSPPKHRKLLHSCSWDGKEKHFQTPCLHCSSSKVPVGQTDV